ncbi:inverse autotransporter beta domain-containing protein [Xenorhabdus mauleonii]|uniref:Adhesin/invasin n=1 Tax=Xenorhabdus mauleonii TaxID=351675 RepID=A0A1I3L003_9GAMM|nr:inverse autotransporter beta domain-containing protein [Xenorhabdus mauleonii]SFI78000.1 adhesin/invasin [Xenorhabdus mauleonii]
MDSYINHKSIRFSVLLYSLLLPMTPMNAFSAGEKSLEDKAAKGTWLNPATANPEENDKAGVVTQNIQQVSNVLSSSPAQLAEQAKSYALGKINNTIATETQQWLSRYGTARINFSLDRKGKLDNSAVDLLLPLYDNKTDWLLFTQLGYRHKDSRHTLNLGLGGRYFTPGWMYGINTFFDNDVTGKNKRLGVGGEAWTDYVKLSANTYWRVTKWHQSLKGKEYEERPANGFDLSGEFYLPAYPNLGGKLAYEQYYGDNVALFNRDTQQKNPSLARIGLNYTPIPLVTMGVDYKYGSGGKSETLFQANLNYRFGTPFDVQISPSSVASLRTLAGSRYDLVERNNNIVLEYRKKPEFNITLPNFVSGYSAQQLNTVAKIIAAKPVKQIDWQADPQFIQNGGVIIPRENQIDLVLPTYTPNGVNDYTLMARADSHDGRQRAAQMKIIVEPFIVKEKSIEKTAEGPLVTNGQSAYDLAATITYGLNKNNKSLANHSFSNVEWYLKPENKEAILTWDKSGKSGTKGQLTATLASKTPLDKNTKIYLKMDGMEETLIGGGGGTINFDNVKFDKKMHQQASGSLPLKGNGQDTYTFKVKVLNAQNEPIKTQFIPGVTWKIKDNKDAKEQMKLVTPENSMTDGEGYLVAKLTSQYGFDDIIVEATLNSSTDGVQTLSSEPVKFEVIPQFAGILLKSATVPDFSKEFSAQEQERPRNVHDKLEVYLTRKQPNQATTSPITPDTGGSSEHIHFSIGKENAANATVDQKTGKITFPPSPDVNAPDNIYNYQSGKANVTAHITDRTTGAKATYTYNFNIKQTFHYFPKPSKVPFQKMGDPSTSPTACHGQSGTWASTPVSSALRDLVDEYGSTDPKNSNLGIFHNPSGSSEYILMFASLDQNPNSPMAMFLLYNYKTNSVKPRDPSDKIPGHNPNDSERENDLNTPPYIDTNLIGNVLCIPSR